MQRFTRHIPALIISIALTLPVVAGFAVAETCDKPATIVARGSDGEEVTVTLDDGTITVISTEDGKTATHIVDLDAVGLLAADAVDEALVDMDGVFEKLQDLQLQFRVGEDNRLNLSCDDKEFELDLDQVMAQVASAVEFGLQEIDTGEWTRHGDRWDDFSEEDLQDELRDLKAEMQSLRAELRQLKKLESD